MIGKNSNCAVDSETNKQESVEELPGKDGESEAVLAVEVGAAQIKGPGVNVELEGLPECPESCSITAVYMR